MIQAAQAQHQVQQQQLANNLQQMQQQQQMKNEGAMKGHYLLKLQQFCEHLSGFQVRACGSWSPGRFMCEMTNHRPM